VVDVVPFVALPPLRRAPGEAGAPSADPALAVTARDLFAAWAGTELSVPCFRYGPMPDGTVRTLPEIRRQAFGSMRPDTGPGRPHPTAGATAVGARPVLVAYNLWLAGSDITAAREIARAIRQPSVRALAFDLGHAVQVSCNLLNPSVLGPAQAFDEVAARLPRGSAGIERAELVGLVPEVVLATTPRGRWRELAIGPDVTIEARLADPSLRTR
jgi:glutamate formiminotransferase